MISRGLKSVVSRTDFVSHFFWIAFVDFEVSFYFVSFDFHFEGEAAEAPVPRARDVRYEICF